MSITKKATSEEVWATIKALGEAQQRTEEAQQRTEEAFREAQKARKETEKAIREARREVAEAQKETARIQRRADKRFNKLEDLFTSAWGKLIESLVEGDLVRLLREKGISIDHVSSRSRGTYKGRHWEIDLLALNCDEAVAVEVKTMLKVKDVDKFLKETIGRIRELLPGLQDKTFYGGVAYIKADEGASAYAEKKGLFVIQATGNSASVTNAKDFKPKAF